MIEDKLYELRKDVWYPGNYYRAGIQKTEAEWAELFDFIDIDFYSEWFIDLSEHKEHESIDELQELINKVFERKQLNSISYKEAAREVAQLYLKQNQK